MNGSTTSFLTPDELQTLGLAHCGTEVLISRYARIYHPERLAVGDRCRIDDFCLLSAGGGITLGCNVHIGAYSALFGGAGIELHDFTGLSPRVSIFSESEDVSGKSLINPTVPAAFRSGILREKVILERHAAVGAHAVLLPGAMLAEGSVLGTLSLLAKPTLPWFVYFGAPARKLRPLSTERGRREIEYYTFLSEQQSSLP